MPPILFCCSRSASPTSALWRGSCILAALCWSVVETAADSLERSCRMRGVLAAIRSPFSAEVSSRPSTVPPRPASTDGKLQAAGWDADSV
jgi:hypothetical protein